MVPDLTDTIVAIGCALGGAARGLIRVSGWQTPAVIGACFHSDQWQPSTALTAGAYTGELVVGIDGPRLPCDLFLWPDALSYTRQPSAELHVLGSVPLMELAVAGLCRLGVRAAVPGEFTLRAFLAGRLDLIQAEAVLGVIDAQSDQSLQTALCHLAGGISKPLVDLRERLLGLLAHLEAGLDFVEEDISFISSLEIERQLSVAQEIVASILAQLHSRGSAQSLPKVVLVGQPNAGKSSLFNALVDNFPALAKRSRALVSAEPGTTRDYLSATVDLHGLACELVDTAGVDRTDVHGIPVQAQAMTSDQLRQADCILLCVDITMPPSEGELTNTLTNSCKLLVITKADLRTSDKTGPEGPVAIYCSSRTGEGLEAIADAIAAVVSDDGASGVLSTAARCVDSLTRAQESLHSALNVVTSGGGDELAAAEIRTVLDEIGQVVGATYTNDILDRIFSQFCIGK